MRAMQHPGVFEHHTTALGTMHTHICLLSGCLIADNTLTQYDLAYPYPPSPNPARANSRCNMLNASGTTANVRARLHRHQLVLA